MKISKTAENVQKMLSNIYRSTSVEPHQAWAWDSSACIVSVVFLLMMITACFSNNALQEELHKLELTPEQFVEFRDAFEIFDRDQDGTIDNKELLTGR